MDGGTQDSIVYTEIVVSETVAHTTKKTQWRFSEALDLILPWGSRSGLENTFHNAFCSQLKNVGFAGVERCFVLSDAPVQLLRLLQLLRQDKSCSAVLEFTEELFREEWWCRYRFPGPADT